MPKGKKNSDPGARTARKKERAREAFSKRASFLQDITRPRQFESGKIYKQESKGDVTKWYKATKHGNLVRIPIPINPDK